MNGQPGSSDDIRPQMLTSYMQSLQRRPQDEESDDEEPVDHTMDYDSPEEYGSSPSTYLSRPTNRTTDEYGDMSEIYYIYDSPTNPHLPPSPATEYDWNDPPTYNDDGNLEDNYYGLSTYDDNGDLEDISYV
jgi:hypothetical protein